MEYVLAVCKMSKPIELSVLASDSGARKSGFPAYGGPQKLSSRFPTVRSADTVLPETARRLREKFTALRAAGTIGPMSRICFIDDGSKDATWQLISDLHARDPVFSGIRLSRNRGHQNALLCGLMTLRDRADCVISMDADLQDPPADRRKCRPPCRSCG